MRVYLVLFLLLTSISFSWANYTKAPPPVTYVNPKSFSGLWYEIARTYNSFEKNCVGASVEYKLIDEFKYDVTNRCFEKTFEGKLITYNGKAKALYEQNMSQLEKTYFWIFSKDYRVIYLDDYKTAVMSDENMENLWIMNRKPFISKKKLDSILMFLDNYVDTSKLIFTPQNKDGKYK
ncbi:lipocalin family protein [Campylobacterota bacterium DY0563]